MPHNDNRKGFPISEFSVCTKRKNFNSKINLLKSSTNSIKLKTKKKLKKLEKKHKNLSSDNIKNYNTFHGFVFCF